ncbi:MAG: FimV/HubP family polar landmark protein [Pseudohongiellaceae bacterium]
MANSQAVAEGNTVIVQPGDSLFRIAMENRPDQSVSLQQTMVAIQRLNPDAFVDGNLNRVKAGERLLLPSIGQITDINLDDAISSISLQNQIIRNNNSSNIESTDRQEDGRFSILRAEDELSNISDELLPLQQENSRLDQRLIELENLIAINLEERDRARLQREELNSRLLQLNAQIDDAKELIRLQDLQLAQLRAQLAETSVSPAEIAMPGLRESANITEDFVENESGWTKVRNSFLGFFLSNSPLVTVAAPLALLLLGWLLWWDRANYAESKSGEAVEKPNKFQSHEADQRVDPENKHSATEIDSSAASQLMQGRVVKEGAEPSSTQSDSVNEPPASESIEFVGDSADDDSFADLDFLSDEEQKELDTPGAIEEIFYLGDEESATKLELAYAYVKMNDFEGAKEIISEVIQEGNADQKKEAEKLLRRMDSNA